MGQDFFYMYKTKFSGRNAICGNKNIRARGALSLYAPYGYGPGLFHCE